MKETWVQSLGREDPLEEEMATHSSILAWRSPWTEEPQSTGSQRVRYDSWTEEPQSIGSQRVRYGWAQQQQSILSRTVHTWSSERSVHRKTQRKQSQEIHIPVNSCQRGFLKVPTNNFPIGYPLTAREAGKCSLSPWINPEWATKEERKNGHWVGNK